MQPMNRKCALFTDSVIRRMTRIAIANNAINLAQGFPDFDPPKAMTDRLIEVANEGPHQYAITMGAPNFRRAVAAKTKRFMGRDIDPETEIVVTIGSTEAMVDTIFALTNPGDKIAMGNVDPSSKFRNGSVEDVKEATLKLMEKCSSYKNFVPSSGCDIPPMTPWENIQAFFTAVDEFYA